MNFRSTAKATFAHFPLAEALFRRFIWSRIHFPEAELRVLNSLPPNAIDVAIDVGAAQGSYAWVLNRKARKVYAFEPGEQHYRFMKRAVLGSRICLIRAAVGDLTAEADLYVAGNDAAALHTATLSQMNPVARTAGIEVQRVKQVTLDWFSQRDIDASRSVDLLKIDVEGYELQVLNGARLLIVSHWPLIICEIEKRHNPDYRKVFEFLWALGYESNILRAQGFEVFHSVEIDELQREESLVARMSRRSNSRYNCYLNNFVFQHPRGKLKIAP